jgi:hypothetical protein
MKSTKRMTLAELRFECAELLGWKYEYFQELGYALWRHPTGSTGMGEPPWYPNCLNAAFTAEQQMLDILYYKVPDATALYLRHLRNVIGCEGWTHMVRAKPKERCRAIIETMREVNKLKK